MKKVEATIEGVVRGIVGAIRLAIGLLYRPRKALLEFFR